MEARDIESTEVLINKAYNICCTNYRLTNALKHLQNVSQYRNSSTHWIIKQILEKLYTERKHDLNCNMNVCGSDNNLSETIAPKVPYETVPYKGKVGEKLFKFLKSSFKKLTGMLSDG